MKRADLYRVWHPGAGDPRRALAREPAPPLLFNEAHGTTKHVLFGSVALTEEEKALEDEP